jgi:DNA-binding IclR family transcriptional regulator
MGMKTLRTNKYPVKSVVKTLAILEHLGASANGISLTEMSKQLKIGKSTVHRLLATLRDHDFVWLDANSSRYVLGGKILQFSEQLSRQSILIRCGEPILAALTQKTGETCNLGVLDGRDVVYLIITESMNPLRMTGQIGKRLPAHCTAIGRTILAGLPRDELLKLYGRTQKLDTFNPKSPTTVPDLISLLRTVRRTGFAYDNEELYKGVFCVGAPIRNHSGEIMAAVSISLPSSRIDAKKLARLRTLLFDSAAELSRQMGYNDAELAETSA